MALYAIVGRLGLYGCTRPARGMQSSTCAGIIVILYARQKSGIFHLKIYGKQFLCLLAAQMYGGGTTVQPLHPLEGWRLHWI